MPQIVVTLRWEPYEKVGGEQEDWERFWRFFDAAISEMRKGGHPKINMGPIITRVRSEGIEGEIVWE